MFVSAANASAKHRDVDQKGRQPCLSLKTIGITELLKTSWR
jgi:hypothetical protein